MHPCFAKAPRYKVAEWRAGCCDGDAPIGATPKHLLAAVHLQGSQAGGQEGQAGTSRTRLAQLQAAAKEWQRSLCDLLRGEGGPTSPLMETALGGAAVVSRGLAGFPTHFLV